MTDSLEEYQLKVPDLGAEEQVVRLSCWLVDIGDYVNAGDRVVELVLPGITCDISSEVAGVLEKIQVVENAQVHPGMVLGIIRPDKEE